MKRGSRNSGRRRGAGLLLRFGQHRIGQGRNLADGLQATHWLPAKVLDGHGSQLFDIDDAEMRLPVGRVCADKHVYSWKDRCEILPVVAHRHSKCQELRNRTVEIEQEEDSVARLVPDYIVALFRPSIDRKEAVYSRFVGDRKRTIFVGELVS